MILEISGLSKTYPDGTEALKNVSLDVKRGERVVILGLSGAGKSTFLRCINRLVQADTGTIKFQPDNDSKIYEMSNLPDSRLSVPRSRIGMIFQQFNLVDRLTVIKNVLTGGLSRYGTLSSLFHIFPPSEVRRAKSCIDRVELNERMYVRAADLSGGQKQRVGIARALMQSPSLMLADEPVASLDPATSKIILDVLARVTEEDNITTLINLHSIEFARGFAKRVIAFKSGELVFDGAMSELDENRLNVIYSLDAPNRHVSRLMVNPES
jgi:phosphonate transport system ATP-binding protein